MYELLMCSRGCLGIQYDDINYYKIYEICCLHCRSICHTNCVYLNNDDITNQILALFMLSKTILILFSFFLLYHIQNNQYNTIQYKIQFNDIIRVYYRYFKTGVISDPWLKKQFIKMNKERKITPRFHLWGSFNFCIICAHFVYQRKLW